MLLPKVSLLDTAIGRYLCYSTGDSLPRILLADGIHEPQVLAVSRFILNHSSRNNILDLGANFGTYSIPIALEFSGKHVFSFEIQRNVYYALCGNIFLNSVPNITAINKGISSISGEIEIPKIDYFKCSNIGAFSVSETAMASNRFDFNNDSITGSEKACTITLDLFGENTGDIALIKLDIEGHELEALIGGRKFIADNGFPPIIFECWPFEWFKDNKRELFSFLIEIGYNNISNDIGHSNFLAQSSISTHKKFFIKDNLIGIYPE